MVEPSSGHRHYILAADYCDGQSCCASEECPMTTSNEKPNSAPPPQPPSSSEAVDETARRELREEAPDTVPARIGEDIQNHLGRKLKASYDELVRQPVPDRFRQLLEELEKREKKT
jgi:Anti-sigma factor NepR